MEEQKATSVDEKRLSKGVIRRRSPVPEPAAVVKPEPAPLVVEAKPIAVSVPVESPVKQSAQSAIVSEVIQETPPAPIVTKPVVEARLPAPVATKGLRVIGHATLKEPVKPVPKGAPEAAKVPVAEPVIPVTPVKVAVAEVPAMAAKPEEKRYLTFKDRLRGTIALKPVDRKDGPSMAASRKPLRAGVAATPNAVVISDEQDKLDAKKGIGAVAKIRKGPKAIGGDLDIEGLGRAENLQHLSRVVTVDRVFQPSASGMPRKKKIISRKGLKSTVLTEKKASKRFVELEGAITVGNLCQQLGVKSGEVIKKLMAMGVMAALNHVLDHDTAVLIASDYQYEVRDVGFKETSVLQSRETIADDPASILRPPIVTVMGHVDHGKTSLLDAIRSTKVTEGEAGGITQHIGAYTVELPKGRVTFLDTPGHEAFAAMRGRGAQVTDIIILVVAADDGIMPQTIESINHAKAAGVPIIVAVNKIDKEGANTEKVYRQLSEHGLLSESWGGETQFVHVSALKKTGIDELLEAILLQAEILEVKANPKARASGTVIEAKLDRFRGAVCTLLVQNGTLKVSDYIVMGTVVGKVKAMTDWRGVAIKDVGPSTAVEVLGLEGVPGAGDAFHVVASEQDARAVAENRLEEKRKADLLLQKRDPADLFNQLASGIKEFSLIVKSDVQGSLEAIRDAIQKLGTDAVKTKLMHGGVGGITESDVNLAAATTSMIIGFNVRPETGAIHLAKEKGVRIEVYKIIYDLVNDVKLAMQGLLEPDRRENYLGRAEVKQVFEVSKLGFVAGSLVNDGVITRNASIRVLRENVIVFEGKVVSLRRFKDDAREVKQGFECGIGFEGFKDVRAGDVIEAYEIELIQRLL
jgi:translation initiation factor IF-2